jgi:uncharacterized protein (DUF2062 family)
MILGALQFITNPFTALPIYGGTFLLGRKLLSQAGFEVASARLPSGWQDKGFGELFGELDLGSAIGQAVLCLVVGGVVSGLVLGALLDAVYLLGARAGTHPAPPASGSTDRPQRPL